MVEMTDAMPKRPRNWAHSWRKCGSVGVELLAILVLLAVGLNPVLTTVVVADDLIGPFSMYINSGPGLLNFLNGGWQAASYGHFNYIGQLFGAFVNWAWLELMLQGVRFSTIYFFTKLFVFTATVYATSSAVVAIMRLWKAEVRAPQLRLIVALLMIGTLQLHLVWSNDPVGSYPMSGYASLALGLLALRASALLLAEPRSIRRMCVAGASLLVAVLYYEINIAVVPAIFTLAVSYVLSDEQRRRSAFRRLFLVGAVYVLPCLLILELQRRNAAESAAYQGTAIALGWAVFSTLGNLTVSSLPWSSWHLAFDWILHFPTVQGFSILAGLFLLCGGALYWYHFRESVLAPRPTGVTWIALTLGAYWLAATGIQASTVKVQNEATRIGSVYNFYAVGSMAVVAIVAVLILMLLKRAPGWLGKSVVVSLLAVAGLSQMFVNHAIQSQHYGMLPQNRNLLVAFSERRPIEERCGSLQAWLAMGWPQYYSNSMASGMEKAYQDEFDEQFCGRF